MRTIWKFVLPLTPGVQLRLDMPSGAEILHVATVIVGRFVWHLLRREVAEP